MNIEIDNYPVSQLQSRYSIGKQAVYNRLDALDIKPSKEGNRSYLTADQVRLLDDLHEHIKAGGTMADFPGISLPQLEMGSPLDRVESPLDAVETSITAAANFADLVKAIASVVQPTDPLRYMEVLERAAEKGWLLTTAEVRELIGVKPTAAKGEDSYQRGCWLFTKAGKIGSQTAWRVGKRG
jgi:hypothetical protein